VRPKIQAFFESIDLLATRLARAVQGWMLWPIFYAMTSGTGLWALTHKDRLGAMDTNKLAEVEFVRSSIWVGVAFAILMLPYVITAIVLRKRHGSFSLAHAAGLLNGRLAPLLSLPLIGALCLPRIEADSPKQTVFFIVLALFPIGRGLYAWVKPTSNETDLATSDDPATKPKIERFARIGVGVFLASLWAAYASFFARASITNHHALNSRTTDLGYYDNIFYQSIHGHPLGCTWVKSGYHGSAHFDPILILLSPLYLLYPRAEMLLVLQAIWLGAGVIPVFFIARHKGIGRVAAGALAAAYAMYPALQGANMYEFHSLSLLSTLMLWLLYFVETGRLRAYWIMIIPTLLTREDVPLMLCFVGLYMILSGRPRLPRAGWITILVSLAYFVIVKRFFMNATDVLNTGKDSYSFAYYYEDLIPNHNGVGGLGLSLLGNPAYAVKTIFGDPKVHYLLMLFVPLLFLPFFARKGRVLLIYGLLFCTLATRAAVFTIHFQYSNVLISFAFFATALALSQIADGGVPSFVGLDAKRLQRALAGVVLVSTTLVCWKFGGVWENKSFRGGFAPVTRTLNDHDREQYAWVSQAVDQIPKTASVAATNKMGPHVSNRKTAYFYPEHMNVEFVFVDEAELRGGDLDKHNKALAAGQLVLVSRRDTMVLYKHK
jgi:uncharacterized membrane protein